MSLGLILASAGVGLLLLMLVQVMPQEKVQKNAARSAETLYEEGIYPTEYTWCNSTLDNWTDSQMILIASTIKEDATALDRALKGYNPWYSIDGYGVNPWEAICLTYGDFSTEGMESGLGSYARYWHGYVVTLRTALSFTDFEGIRTLNLILQTGLLLAVVIHMILAGQYLLIVPYVLSMAALLPLHTSHSLQYSTVYYITQITSLAVLKLKNRKSLQSYIFLFSGILTAYMDFLTYPMVSCCIPLVICLSMDRDRTWKERALFIIKAGFYWCMGYVGMWAMKWILATLLTDFNVIQDALANIKMRSFASTNENAGTDVTVGDTLYRNYLMYFGNALSWYPFLAGLILSFLAAIQRKGKNAKDIALYWFIAALPLAWFIMAMNHSNIHAHFTCRDFAVTSFSLMTAATHIRFKKKRLT